jgi:F420-dependent oxidoreductase-like protein
MKLRIFTEPQQGASYETLLAVARVTEEQGFDAFFRSDHYQNFDAGDGRPGSTDAWITLAGLARETSRVRLGTLVSPATFRLPGPLAISVAQVDVMSSGRVELGLGAGWNETEHRSYGIPFPPTGVRFAMLEEQLAVIHGLWTAKGPFSYQGQHYQLVDSPALPKPAQPPHPPIILGGWGQTRTPRLVAEYADEYNVPFGQPKDAGTRFDLVRAACEKAGRDPATVVLSAATTVCCGSDDAEVARRARAIGQDVDKLRSYQTCGTPEQVVERIRQFQEAGAERLYLQVLDLADLDHLRLIGSEVLPQFQ